MFKAAVRIICLCFFIFSIFLASPIPASADIQGPSSTTASVFVPPHPWDLQLSMYINPNKMTYNQLQELEVKITYGTILPFDSPVTIVAQWTRGTVPGGHPNEDILDYVVGSADTAYGNTQPIIDTVNRTVTWTMPSFPGQLSNQQLYFRLKTNTNYTGSQNVEFTIRASLTDLGAVTDFNIIRNYHHEWPSTTPTPIPTTSPTPEAFNIKTVDIQAISDNGAIIKTTANQHSKVKVSFGTSAEVLNKSVSDDSFGLEHVMTLSGLFPDTKYYFKVASTNPYNKTVTSELFSFKTAIASEIPAIALNTFAVTSANKILVAPVTQPSDDLVAQEQRTLVIPQSTIYDLRFSLTKRNPMKSIKVVLRNKDKVLGVNTSLLGRLLNFNNQNDPLVQDNFSEIMPTVYASDVNVKEVSMTEIQPGVYYGRLISNLPLGEYELFAVASDINGNINETKLSNVKIINRLTTLSKDTKKFIENARIYLSFYNLGSKKFEPLLPTLMAITNPSFTDSNGESPLVLPQGKYRILVSDLGYKDKTIDFTIGIGKNDGFPIIYLEKEPSFNLMSTLTYYGRGIRDVYVYYTMQYFTALSKSLRFFNLINAVSLGLFVIVTFLSFMFRTHIPFPSIFSYPVFHLRRLRGQNMSALYLEGTVIDEKTKTPISRANAYLINSSTHQTIRQTSTNIFGHFYFNLNNHKNYEILIVKEGFEIAPIIKAGEKPVVILLKKAEAKKGLFGIILNKFIEMPIGFLFEYLLVTSFMFEISSIPFFGFQRTSPYLLISTFNLLLWVLHLRQKRQNARII